MIVRVLHGLNVADRATTVSFCAAPNDWVKARGLGSEIEIEYVNCVQTRFDPTLHRRAAATFITYELLSLRSNMLWWDIKSRIQSFLEASEVNVAFPQDDYTCSAYLDRFFSEGLIHYVYSAILNNLDRIYPRTVSTIPIRPCPTGFYDPRLGERLKLNLMHPRDRSVDFFSRVRKLPLYFGATSRNKAIATEEMGKALAEHGLYTDVSSSNDSALVGSSWHRRLANSRTTYVGLGGAYRTDPLGYEARWTVKLGSLNVLSEEQIFRVVRDRKSKEGNFSAHGPRIFEALALGTIPIMTREAASHIPALLEHGLYIDSDVETVASIARKIRDHDFLGELSARSALIMSKQKGLTSVEFFDDVFSTILPAFKFSRRDEEATKNGTEHEVRESASLQVSLLKPAIRSKITSALLSLNPTKFSPKRMLTCDISALLRSSGVKSRSAHRAAAQLIEEIQSGRATPIAGLQYPLSFQDAFLLQA